MSVMRRTYKEPIRQNTHDTEGVGCLYNLIRSHAVASGYPIVPLLGNRVALENVPKEADHAPQHNNDETDAQNPNIYLLRGKAQEEEADAELDEHHVEDVAGSSKSLPLNKWSVSTGRVSCLTQMM